HAHAPRRIRRTSSHLAIPASLGCKWRIDLGQCRASRDCRYCPAPSGNVYLRPADTMNTLRRPFRQGRVGAPDLEPPGLAILGVDLAHGAAEIERFGERF